MTCPLSNDPQNTRYLTTLLCFPLGPDIGLLPPSAFESKVKSGDPWKEIAKATEEVAKLKLENSKLR